MKDNILPRKILFLGLTAISFLLSGLAIDMFGPTHAAVAVPQFTGQITAYAQRSNALIFDPSSSKIYASIPSGTNQYGNSVVRIDPATGQVEQSVWVGSEPGKMVLAADGNSLYVLLGGARSVRRIDLATWAAGQEVRVGTTAFDGPLQGIDITVSPSDPNVIAVSRLSAVTSNPKGVAVFDNGVQRPNTGGTSGSITFTSSDAAIFGIDFNGGYLQPMVVGPGGIVSAGNGTTGVVGRLAFVNGSVYVGNGSILDGNGSRVATLDLGSSQYVTYPFVVDAPNHRAFYVSASNNALTVRSYDTDTYVLNGSITLSGISSNPIDVVRFDTNGLAISTSDGPTYFIRSDLVGPGTIGSPAPSPTPTPSQNWQTFIQPVAIPVNDVQPNSADGLLYATVPSVAGSGLGNTITRIDPRLGTVLASTFVGSEPKRLKVSDDGGTLYTVLSGINAVRRFDAGTQTAGIQFSPTGTNNPIVDLAILPGHPESVVISSGNSGIGLYDNGVRKTNAPQNTIGSIETNADGSVIYGYNDLDSGFDLYKLNVDANGLAVDSDHRNLLYYYDNDFKFDEGKLFGKDGRVVDPEANAMIGKFNIGATAGSSVVVDHDTRRVYLLVNNEIQAFDLDTYNKIGSIPIPYDQNSYTNYTGLVRWGVNGLAVGVKTGAGANYLNIIESSIVAPSGTLPLGHRMELAAKSVNESSQTVSVNVARTGDLGSTTTVNYATADGTAVGGQDYVPVNGTLTFLPGETTKTVPVTLINDNVYEGNETFSMNLSETGTSGETLRFPTSTVVTIVDNESPPAIQGSPVTVHEPPNGQTLDLQVVVSLRNPSAQTVTFDYATVNGTAQAGTDFLATSGTLTFAPLETTKSIPVTILGDNVSEATEQFSINLQPTSPGTGGVYQYPVITILPPRRSAFDFDGDGKTDLSVFRPNGATGTEWWLLMSSDGGNYATQFGNPSDKPVAADYTGDGKADIAFWRPSTGEWFILRSEDFSYFSFPFGSNGDVPAPADYDGDGKTDAAVFRPATATWYILRSTGGTTIQQFGSVGDVPVAGDYDGDTRADMAVFRPDGVNGSEWWIFRSSNASVVATQFGSATDMAVPADYTGDGKTDVAIWRPSTGQWYVLRSEDSSFYAFPFGSNGDIPVPGDYDGDGKTDAAVFRPAGSMWFAQGSTSGTIIQQFGAAGDVPVPSELVR